MLCNVCETSHRLGTWLAPNAIRRSHGLREPKYHSSNCYFRLTNVTRVTYKSKHTVENPDLPSAMRPIPHSEELPVPKFPENLICSDDNCDSEEDHEQQEQDSVDFDPTFQASCSSSQSNILWKGGFNDLVRDLNLSKKKEDELLGSKLKGWNLLHQDNETCFSRNRQNEFREFFSQENNMLFCNYVFSVTKALGHQHDPPE